MNIGQISNVKPEQRLEPVAVSTAASAPNPGRQAAIALTSNPVQPAVAAPAPADVEQALKSINKVLESQPSDLEFTTDPDTNSTVIKVVDRQTKEIIRQMPSVEALEISKALDKLQGLLVRQKA